MTNKYIDSIQRRLSKSTYFVKLLCKLRNQINRIISYHFSQDHLIENGGESALIDKYKENFKIVFDVGANKGEWSDYLLTKKNDLLKLVLIEPSKNTFNYLVNKYNNNPLIQIFNLGMSDSNGILDFYAEENMGETSSFVKNNAAKNSIIEKVNVTTIDQFCEEHSISFIDFLKIDCEGFDLKVMLGAEKMIKTKSIRYIQFEYNHDWLSAGATLKFALDFLIKNGYNVYVVNNKGLSNYDYKVFGDFFGYSNFFAELK